MCLLGILRYFSTHLSSLQELQAAIMQKESTLNKLASCYERLSPNDTQLVEQELTPLREAWQSLVDKVNGLLSQRQDALDQARTYHHKHTQLDSDLAAALGELDAIKRDKECPVEEKLHRLQVSRTSVLTFLYFMMSQRTATLNSCLYYSRVLL